MSGSMHKKCLTDFFIVFAITIVCLAIPGISAAVPDDNPRITPFMTYADIAVTNGSLTNHTFPSEYQVTPTLLKVQVELKETVLPAPKGEMAAGPRAIGFFIDPVSLAIFIFIVVVVAAGMVYFLKRKRDEEEAE